MRSMSFAFTTLLLVAAIAVPAASAKPTNHPSAWQTVIEDTGSSRTPAAPVTRPAPSDNGFPWETVGLILVAAGIGLAGAVAVVRIRRRTHLPA